MTIKAGPINPNPASLAPAAKLFESAYRSNISDLKIKPLASIITSLSGYPITVNYYASVEGRDMDLDGYNTTHTPLQQYREIKDLQIKLDGAFNYSMIAATGFTDYTATAKFFAAGFKPNEGNIVIASIGNGRLGRFEVTQAMQLSIYDGTAFSVELRLMGLATSDILAEISSRVVERLTYVKDFLINGQNPLLGQENYARLQELRKYQTQMTDQYLGQFISKEFGTFLVPSQMTTTYDPYVTQCMLDITPVDQFPAIKAVRNLDVDQNNSRGFVDIYTVLLDRDLAALPFCFTQATRRDVYQWARHPRFASIAHSGISTCIYPKDHAVGVDATYGLAVPYAGGLGLVNTAPVLPEDLSGVSVPSQAGNGYVFTERFYAQLDVSLTRLESLVRDYLNDRQLNVVELLALNKERHQWSQVDQFYYVPVLIILTSIAIGEL